MPRRHLPQILLVLFAGAIVYANTFSAGFVLDDDAVIGTYGPQRIMEILLHGGSRRIVDATFALNHLLHGETVAGYHIVNLLIHLATTLTLYLLASAALSALRTTMTPQPASTEPPHPADRFVPFAAALLFAVHPLQTQAVTYIVQRYTCLATLFYLLAALLFVRSRLACVRGETLSRIFVPAGGCVLTGILALGSKQIAATLPLMLIALELFLFRGRLLGRRFFLLCGSGILVGGAGLLFAWRGLSSSEMLTVLHHATAEDLTIPRLDYLLTQTQVVATYLRLLILPYGQSLFHDDTFSTALFSMPVLAAGALHLVLLGGTVALHRRSGKEPGEKGILLRLAALGICWFYIALIVESSIFPITDRIFEHRVYLPSAGFFLAVAALGSLWIAGRGERLRRGWALLLIAAVLLGGLTLNRNRLWGDTFLLWQDTVAKAPNKDLALANLAGEYMKLKQPAKALPLFVHALELNPRFMTRTKIYLGMTLQRLNVDPTRYATGEELLAIADQRKLDDREEARLNVILANNLGVAHEYLGDPAKAMRDYRAALQLDPDHAPAWYNRGLLAAQQGNPAEAAAALKQLQRLDPTLAGRLAARVGKRP